MIWLMLFYTPFGQLEIANSRSMERTTKFLLYINLILYMEYLHSKKYLNTFSIKDLDLLAKYLISNVTVTV